MEYKITKQDAEILHEIMADNIQRNFDTDQDRTDLFRKLVELGKFLDFQYFAWIKFVHKPIECDHAAWLFIDNPERACCLVAKYWREYVTKKT